MDYNYLSYLIIFALSLTVLVVVSGYAYKHRNLLAPMDGMMIAMTLGMFSGLISATLYLIPTGNFLNGVIFGSLIGLAFGVSLGRLGGHLGVMEGVMAGPMGGMMGAMLGQMVRPFDIEVFMPFLMFIFSITMLGMAYAVYDKANSLDTRIASKFFLTWTIPVVIFLLAVSFELSFPLGAEKASPNLTGSGNGAGEVTEQAPQEGASEIELLVKEAEYSPSTIYAEANTPIVIKARALKTAGCLSEIVFKELGVKKVVPIGGATTIKIKPQKAGVYTFSCPMGMAPGKLVVR